MIQSKNLLALMIFMITTSIVVKAQGALDAYKHRIYVKGNDTLPYRILYPKGFDSNKKYPLVLVLHGAGERGTDNEKQLVYGAQLFLEQQEQYPAIVVFPQCPLDSYWSNVAIVKDETGKRTFNFKEKGKPTNAMHSLIGLLKQLQNSGNVDNDRIYLGGLSMGGMGTFELLYRKPNTFAAAFPICGGGAPESVRKYAKRVKSLWVFHGEEDSVVPVKHSRVMAKAIVDAGGNVKLTVYSGVNHNSWQNAFSEPELLPWLFSKKK